MESRPSCSVMAGQQTGAAGGWRWGPKGRAPRPHLIKAPAFCGALPWPHLRPFLPAFARSFPFQDI